MLAGNLLGVPGTLSLVEHQQVLGRDGGLPLAVVPDVVLHIADEDLAASAGFLESVLQDLDKGAVAR